MPEPDAPLTADQVAEIAARRLRVIESQLISIYEDEECAILVEEDVLRLLAQHARDVARIAELEQELADFRDAVQQDTWERFGLAPPYHDHRNV